MRVRTRKVFCGSLQPPEQARDHMHARLAQRQPLPPFKTCQPMFLPAWQHVPSTPRGRASPLTELLLDFATKLRRRHGRPETCHRLALLAHEELLEVVLDAVPGQRGVDVLGALLQELVEAALALAVDVDLREHLELGTDGPGEVVDGLVAPRLLPELVGGEGEDLEAPRGVLVVQLVQALVALVGPRVEARDVHDEEDLAGVVAQRHHVAGAVLHRELVDRAAAHGHHGGGGPPLRARAGGGAHARALAEEPGGDLEPVGDERERGQARPHEAPDAGVLKALLHTYEEQRAEADRREHQPPRRSHRARVDQRKPKKTRG
mmetsp:Transcript_11325/g.32071  ORF Transcript_11325/g.32071 Transcript_11325/m.32071 type:complete len:320 (-) Transcript_11325:35-994(-)